jgi:hypothetical protein
MTIAYCTTEDLCCKDGTQYALFNLYYYLPV